MQQDLQISKIESFYISEIETSKLNSKFVVK